MFRRRRSVSSSGKPRLTIGAVLFCTRFWVARRFQARDKTHNPAKPIHPKTVIPAKNCHPSQELSFRAKRGICSLPLVRESPSATKLPTHERGRHGFSHAAKPNPLSRFRLPRRSEMSPKQLRYSHELTSPSDPLLDRTLADRSQRPASSPLLPAGLRSQGGLPARGSRRRSSGATLGRGRGVLAERRSAG